MKNKVFRIVNNQWSSKKVHAFYLTLMTNRNKYKAQYLFCSSSKYCYEKLNEKVVFIYIFIGKTRRNNFSN